MLRNRLESVLNNESLGAGERETEVSSLLGFKAGQAETLIQSTENALYRGLPDEALSTPFKDYHSILCDLDQGDILIDLGAGYCKGSLLAETLGMGRKCVSLELSPERAGAGSACLGSLGLESDTIRVFDLLRDPLPLERAYYVYLPLGGLIFRPIEALLKAGRSCWFYVSESHGDVLDFFDHLSGWFRPAGHLPGEAQRHKPGIHKYYFSPTDAGKEISNDADLAYFLVRNWSRNPVIELEKESGRVGVSAQSLIPLRYNGEMRFECLEIKRIVDFENVRVAIA